MTGHPDPVGTASPSRPLVELVAVADLLQRAAPYNPRKKMAAPDFEALRRSLREFGAVEPAVVNQRSGNMVGGHQRIRAAEAEGWPEYPVRWVDLDDAQERQLNIALNRIGGTWDESKLAAVLRELDESGKDLKITGLTDREILKLLGGTPRQGRGDPDAAPPKPAKPVARLGDLWQLGPHRLLCGSATDERAARGLLGADLALEGIDLICTDPPYCSGGFQESARFGGSIGSKRLDSKGRQKQPQIANDTLSTRGYQALMRQVFATWNARGCYVFTDWRMWVNLFDAAESSGFGVRQMIVWDKETPGMGQGWRAQHELILFGLKGRRPAGDLRDGLGNVRRSKRTGNPLHVTQKPVDLIEDQLRVSPWAKWIGEPFGGSGSTVIAATSLERVCFVTELDPGYCDVIVERYQDFTGQAAQRIARLSVADEPLIEGVHLADLEAESDTDPSGPESPRSGSVGA